MTIKDIARISGFGVSTVSRALNGHADISDATKRKIEEVVKANNFVPNSNAKSLKQASSDNILIIINGTQNMFFNQLVERIQHELDMRGMKAVFHYLDERETEIVEATRLVTEQKPLGVIFLGGNAAHFKTHFQKINVPSVLCTSNAANLGFNNLASVCLNDTEAGKTAINYLYSMGHKKIGLITGTAVGEYAANNRLLGSVEALKQHGMLCNSTWYEESRFSLEGGYEAAKRLIERHPDITAVFAMADIMAIGAMRAFVDMGRRVPEDISVMGIDGIAMTQFAIPRLTTLAQPFEELAALSVKLLARQLTLKPRVSHELLTAQLIEGGSVKKLI